ncbi:MAG: DUF5615 family PIN-like protein [Thermodesulfovibrionales bacterium]|nr:DUF5615 family PIN-like protein [Thermodesulfovibrionales bacterium]
MSEISLYIDEDVRVLLSEVLRSRGYKAMHVLEVKRSGKDDDEQLAYAVGKKMSMLTHNIGDYIKLSRSYIKENKDHFGIVVSDQIPFNELLRRTLKFLSSYSRESVKNRIVWLQDYK